MGYVARAKQKAIAEGRYKLPERKAKTYQSRVPLDLWAGFVAHVLGRKGR
jgi:hypothetical protein